MICNSFSQGSQAPSCVGISTSNQSNLNSCECPTAHTHRQKAYHSGRVVYISHLNLSQGAKQKAQNSLILISKLLTLIPPIVSIVSNSNTAAFPVAAWCWWFACTLPPGHIWVQHLQPVPRVPRVPRVPAISLTFSPNPLVARSWITSFAWRTSFGWSSGLIKKTISALRKPYPVETSAKTPNTPSSGNFLINSFMFYLCYAYLNLQFYIIPIYLIPQRSRTSCAVGGRSSGTCSDARVVPCRYAQSRHSAPVLPAFSKASSMCSTSNCAWVFCCMSSFSIRAWRSKRALAPRSKEMWEILREVSIVIFRDKISQQHFASAEQTCTYMYIRVPRYVYIGLRRYVTQQQVCMVCMICMVSM